MIFDVIFITFAIESKPCAKFESCLRNQRNYPVSVKDTGFFSLLQLVFSSKCCVFTTCHFVFPLFFSLWGYYLLTAFMNYSILTSLSFFAFLSTSPMSQKEAIKQVLLVYENNGG